MSPHWTVTLQKLHYGQIGTESAHHNSLCELAINFPLGEILDTVLGLMNWLSKQQSNLTKSLHGVLVAALCATFAKGLSHVTFYIT